MNKKNISLEVSYPDGKRIVIPAAKITAVEGDLLSTTVYVPGNVIQIQKPVDEILAVLRPEKRQIKLYSLQTIFGFFRFLRQKHNDTEVQ